jgi:hypothetical protein
MDNKSIDIHCKTKTYYRNICIYICYNKKVSFESKINGKKKLHCAKRAV